MLAYLHSIHLLLLRKWAAKLLDKRIAENHGVPLQMIAIMLWKDVMIKQNLTDEGKAPNELIATAKKFRELFMNNTYQSQDVVKDIYVIDSKNAFIQLEKQISMLPEAGR